MNNIYKKLLKIKKPKLIYIKADDDNDRSRYRILYPNGYCEYDIDQFDPYGFFSESCFACSDHPNLISLKRTLNNMENYDFYHKLKIIKVQSI